MPYDRPIIQIIQECAELLTAINKTPFSRQDIIKLIKWKYNEVNNDTINPLIQGMTDNLRGGAPGSTGRNILHNVGRGQFILSRNR